MAGPRRHTGVPRAAADDPRRRRMRARTARTEWAPVQARAIGRGAAATNVTLSRFRPVAGLSAHCGRRTVGRVAGVSSASAARKQP
jgi:hypothetical protein